MAIGPATRAAEIERMQKKLADQLATAQTTSNMLNRMIEAKNNRPEEPKGTMFAVSCQYNPGGKWYEFLLLRVGHSYYGTGGKKFDSWDEVLEWLDGMNCYSQMHHLLKALGNPALEGRRPL